MTIYKDKFASNIRVTKGFWQGLEDMKADKAYIVAPVKEAWKFSDSVWVIPPLVHEGLWM